MAHRANPYYMPKREKVRLPHIKERCYDSLCNCGAAACGESLRLLSCIGNQCVILTSDEGSVSNGKGNQNR